MLNEQQPQAGKSAGGRFSSLGKPAKLLVLAIIVLTIVAVVAVIFGGSDSNSKQVLDLMTQNQEIIRFSKAQDSKFNDGNTKGLSATTQVVMNSQKFQLSDYLAKAKVKYDPKQLTASTSKQTDEQLQTAAQNNNLDAAYIDYLKSSLTAYLNSVNSAYRSTGSETLKGSLKSASESLQILLNSPQFKS